MFLSGQRAACPQHTPEFVMVVNIEVWSSLTVFIWWPTRTRRRSFSRMASCFSSATRCAVRCQKLPTLAEFISCLCASRFDSFFLYAATCVRRSSSSFLAPLRTRLGHRRFVTIDGWFMQPNSFSSHSSPNSATNESESSLSLAVVSLCTHSINTEISLPSSIRLYKGLLPR